MIKQIDQLTGHGGVLARAADARAQGYLCIFDDATSEAALQAGADKVVLPTHIGAERIAELLLYEESARLIEGLERSHGFQRVLHSFGMELEVITAAPQSPAAGMTVAAIERKAEGDGVVLIGRPNRSAILTSLFEPKSRAGVRG